MMKAVGSALDTTYSGKKWLQWFTKTAKAIIAELDGMPAKAAVRTCTFKWVAFALVSLCHCMQSVAASAAPSDVSKGEITDMKEELTLLLEDEANDDMSYEG